MKHTFLYHPTHSHNHSAMLPIAKVDSLHTNKRGDSIFTFYEKGSERMQGQFSPKSDPADVEKNKVMALLSYLIFFIPLLAARESPFAMYHANQGLILFLAALFINVIGTIIPIIGWFIIIPIGNLLVLVYAIIGIINALNGQTKQLPLIGKFQLIK